MITLIQWLAVPAVRWAVTGLGVAAVFALWLVRHDALIVERERAKIEAGVRRVNSQIVADRAKDEAELAAEKEKADRVDAELAKELAKGQQCILTAETAKSLSQVH